MIGSRPAGHRNATSAQSIAGTISSAFITGIAAIIAVELGLKVWVMLVGVLAYSSRSRGIGAAVVNYTCLVFGLVLGTLSSLIIPVLKPQLGTFDVPTLVAVNTSLILCMRRLPVLNNLLCYILGLTVIIANGEAPDLVVLASLAATTIIGTLAAWAAEMMQLRIAGLTSA